MMVIIYYYINRNNHILFSGDSLFRLGCGRVFEGTYEQMFQSLKKINSLDSNTMVYCGHEYTQKNLDFCIKYDISNSSYEKKKKWIIDRINQKLPTIPVAMKEELNTNIFLRCDNSNVKKSLGMEKSSELEIFKKLRDLKDIF